MLQMLSSSQGSVGCRVIGGWLTSPRKELNEEFTSRIALARLGPILVKYLQNPHRSLKYPQKSLQDPHRCLHDPHRSLSYPHKSFQNPRRSLHDPHR